MIQAIPTKYNGVQFRSRLEAKWAAFFDALGWSWTYEPFDLAGYIPDFQLNFSQPMLVEVKGPWSTDEEVSYKFSRSASPLDLMLVRECLTSEPFPWPEQHIGTYGIGRYFCRCAAGSACIDAGCKEWGFPRGHVDLAWCKKHDGWTPVFAEGDWKCRACGHRGDKHFHLDLHKHPPSFGAAGNAVQWRAP